MCFYMKIIWFNQLYNQCCAVIFINKYEFLGYTCNEVCCEYVKLAILQMTEIGILNRQWNFDSALVCSFFMVYSWLLTNLFVIKNFFDEIDDFFFYSIKFIDLSKNNNIYIYNCHKTNLMSDLERSSFEHINNNLSTIVLNCTTAVCYLNLIFTDWGPN